jgi:hypothetical protein
LRPARPTPTAQRTTVLKSPILASRSEVEKRKINRAPRIGSYSE